jgi:hypothetical protein
MKTDLTRIIAIPEALRYKLRVVFAAAGTHLERRRAHTVCRHANAIDSPQNRRQATR